MSSHPLGADFFCDVTPKDLTKFPMNDYGNSRRVLELHGNDVLYCPPIKKFFIWDGRRFKVDERDEIRKLAQTTMLEFTTQAVASSNDSMARFAAMSLDSRRITGALRELQPAIATLPEEFDTGAWSLNFCNGTLNLRTGELREHSRADRITKLVHFDYDPNASCPTFLTFLERFVGRALVSYLQKVFGYSLSGVTSEKKAFLLLGQTNTGKTTLLDLIRDLFTEYAVTILIDALMQRDEDNNSRADLADLRGARVAITSETKEGQHLREDKLKRITQGQGIIKTARKYENPITFRETHKLFIDANHRPVVRGTDSSIWERLTPIPFDNPLAEDEKDRELPSKLRAEAKGIIAWAVEGTRRWLSETLGTPTEIHDARAAWRSDTDWWSRFVADECLVAPDQKIGAQQLFDIHEKWTAENGEDRLTHKQFSAHMRQTGFKSTKTALGKFYIGLGPKEEPQ